MFHKMFYMQTYFGVTDCNSMFGLVIRIGFENQ